MQQGRLATATKTKFWLSSSRVVTCVPNNSIKHRDCKQSSQPLKEVQVNWNAMPSAKYTLLSLSMEYLRMLRKACHQPRATNLVIRGKMIIKDALRYQAKVYQRLESTSWSQSDLLFLVVTKILSTDKLKPKLKLLMRWWLRKRHLTFQEMTVKSMEALSKACIIRATCSKTILLSSHESRSHLMGSTRHSSISQWDTDFHSKTNPSVICTTNSNYSKM